MYIVFILKDNIKKNCWVYLHQWQQSMIVIQVIYLLSNETDKIQTNKICTLLFIRYLKAGVKDKCLQLICWILMIK